MCTHGAGVGPVADPELTGFAILIKTFFPFIHKATK